MVRAERAVKRVSQTLPWLKAEKRALTAKVSTQPVTRKRRARRRGALRSQIKGLHFTRHSLSVAAEKYKCIPRIKESQLQRKQDLLRKQVMTAKLWSEGLSRVCQPRGNRGGEFTKGELEKLGEYWRGIWQQEGHFNPTHPSLLLWQQETHIKLESCQEDL